MGNKLTTHKPMWNPVPFLFILLLTQEIMSWQWNWLLIHKTESERDHAVLQSNKKRKRKRYICYPWSLNVMLCNIAPSTGCMCSVTTCLYISGTWPVVFLFNCSQKGTFDAVFPNSSTEKICSETMGFSLLNNCMPHLFLTSCLWPSNLSRPMSE